MSTIRSVQRCVLRTGHSGLALVAILACGAPAWSQVSFLVPGKAGVGQQAQGVIGTGIDVVVGQPLEIEASGLVTVFESGGNYFGPDGDRMNTGGWVASAPKASLIGVIGSTPFFVGESYSGPAWASGSLGFGINDDFYGDNAGEFLVEIGQAGDGGNTLGPQPFSPFARPMGPGGGGGNPPAQSGQYSVPGTAGVGNGSSGLVPTGIFVQSGQQLEVAARGSVTAFVPGGNYFGPDGEPGTAGNYVNWFKNANLLALIGRIGNKTFPIGEAYVGIAPSSGELLLGVNDGYYSDNAGSFDVAVLVTSPSTPGAPSGTLPGPAGDEEGDGARSKRPESGHPRVPTVHDALLADTGLLLVMTSTGTGWFIDVRDGAVYPVP